MLIATKTILNKIIQQGDCFNIPCFSCPFDVADEAAKDCSAFDIVEKAKELLEQHRIQEELRKNFKIQPDAAGTAQAVED